jgi:hypothetical protein
MSPLPSDAGPRPLEDFAPLLATKEPVLLVGGQAVNLWAMYYETRTAALAPFVSRDVDVLGDRKTLEALGELARTKPQFFPVKPPSNEIGVIIAKDHNGLPLLIEVLRYVHGVSNAELREPVYTLAIGETHVLVPSPIALMQAKIANVADIAQTGRQDARHVVILAQVLPVYLEDLEKAVTEGRMEERKLIEFLERLLAVVATEKARKVLQELGLDARQFFAGFEYENRPRLRSFIEKRVPRAIPN